MEKKKGLGRGISALIPDRDRTGSNRYSPVDLVKISPNPLQPRKEFKEQEIADLQSSIAKDGLLQPIVVVEEGQGYRLVAGERRLRAVQRLGWTAIPALVLASIEEVELLRKSIVENIQRTNLNPIEEARAYKRLIDDYGYSLENVAQEVAKDLSTISNTIRLLNLPEDVQSALKQGVISAGHARALLMLSEHGQIREMAEHIQTKKLSVRATEKIVKEQKSSADPHLKSALESLQRLLSTKINISNKRKGGKIEIMFVDQQDLERIVNLLLKMEA